MKRLASILCALALVLIPSPVFPQQLNQSAASLSASSTGCTTAASCVALPLGLADRSASIMVNGTFAGTLQFEGSTSSGAQWSALSCPTWTAGAAASSTTGTGAWICDVASLTTLRVRESAFTSGSAIVSLSSSAGVPALSYIQVPQGLSTTNTPSFQGVPLVNGVATTINVTTDFTTANNTSLQTITGLSFTLPASSATNVPFSCEMLYSQATANVAVAFGIQSATISPTNIMAYGEQFTNTTANTEGNLPTLSTTTATAIVSATPAATATVFPVNLSGFIENPSNASSNVINIMVSTATGTDAVTVKRGSYCRLY